MACSLIGPRVAVRFARAPRRRPSLVRAILRTNGVRELRRDRLVEVPLETSSRIVAANGARVWCSRYPGLDGLFRKDRGPSKELGRALCDEVIERFDCAGFFTTDELPGYGLGRRSVRDIEQATGATPEDAVVVYAYGEDLAREIDAYLCERLRQMS